MLFRSQAVAQTPWDRNVVVLDRVKGNSAKLCVEIEIDRDPKLNRSYIPATLTAKQFQKTQL